MQVPDEACGRRFRLAADAACRRLARVLRALHLKVTYLMCGLYLAAAIALPALGIRLADRPARTPDAQAMRVAAVRSAPPLRTATIFQSQSRR